MRNLPEMMALLNNFLKLLVWSKIHIFIMYFAKYFDFQRIIQNSRLISLLNVDVKMFLKDLLKRLKDVLPSLISDNQSAYAAGRFISEGENSIPDVLQIKITDALKLNGLLVTV